MFRSPLDFAATLRLHGAVRLISLLLLSVSVFYGYSVLTHEAIVDSVWDGSIRKMLVERFPMATPEDLEHVHAYVYGGCIIQDMGYYPFSSHFFSDLTHYVRSGDFVVALIRESQDLNEYAFALGALSHYATDNNGHRIATNLAVPILYPGLRRKFGKTVTYWDSPLSHIRTEFGFDVLRTKSKKPKRSWGRRGPRRLPCIRSGSKRPSAPARERPCACLFRDEGLYENEFKALCWDFCNGAGNWYWWSLGAGCGGAIFPGPRSGLFEEQNLSTGYARR